MQPTRSRPTSCYYQFDNDETDRSEPRRRRVMGACLDRFFSWIAEHFTYRPYQRHTNVATREETEEQAEAEQSIVDDPDSEASTSKKILSFFSLRKFKQINGSPVSFELIEDSDWPGQSYTPKISPKHAPSTSPGVDNPIQMLDARNLLLHQGGVSSSTPLSSLELEWEHEDISMPRPRVVEEITVESLVQSVIDSVMGPKRNVNGPDETLSATTANHSLPSSLPASPWSRVSSPNSLEWDPEESEMISEDVETENLLTEIERLTDRTLKETGDWTSAS